MLRTAKLVKQNWSFILISIFKRKKRVIDLCNALQKENTLYNFMTNSQFLKHFICLPIKDLNNLKQIKYFVEIPSE
ncbi:hypothetical protein C1637_21340 [Chryseobacterium lactis]|uniref:Uncharacterized protein n=1 Tax=Chryseobacterium lactis TaxID=1241981 RepID=A0A3G6RQN3_CHRLC|nr:hypothetical protein EG342_16520 [Chryseobacterium lactis]AZB03770.1 hypothetical protein EG341_07395 [Chryseobacterium lactis]PNW11653.1 hypothetical protein C1637_21340 [Chryseobacterium lactis]